MQNPETVFIAGKAFFTFPEGVAQALNTTPRTARRWRAMLIGPPVIQVGNTQLVDPDDLFRWLESRKGTSRRSRAA